MWKPLVRCSIVGGIIAFLWYMVSWMALPFHEKVLSHFTSEEAVASVLLENAPENGAYVLPQMEKGENGKMGWDQAERDGKPFIYANIVREGRYTVGMGRQMIVGLAINIIGAFLITWLLLKTKVLKYWARVRFVTMIGFIVGFLSMMPQWNWWGFSCGFTIVGIADATIAWFLGGLAMAKLVK